MNLFLSAVLLLPMLFAQFLGVSHRTIYIPPPPDVCSSSLPAIETFSGTGALPSCWSATTASGFVPITRSTGVAVQSTPSTQGMAIYTGLTFGTNQQVQATMVWHSGQYTAICVNMLLNGNSTCYMPNINQIISLIAGSGSGGSTVVAGCSAFPSGDVAKLTLVANVYTAIDVTTSTTLCSNAVAGVPTGSPGFIVDNTTNLGDSIANFEAQ